MLPPLLRWRERERERERGREADVCSVFLVANARLG
jgi:hypothetical protein